MGCEREREKEKKGLGFSLLREDIRIWHAWACLNLGFSGAVIVLHFET